jgi:hypothetical protein
VGKKMRHRWLSGVFASLVLWMTIGAFTMAPAGAANWTTRGGAPERSQQAAEPVAAIRLDSLRVVHKVGVSGSQPIMVGRYIYHLAGNGLWQIDPSSLAGEVDATATSPAGVIQLADHLNHVGDCSPTGTDCIVRSSTSGLTYAEIASMPFLFFGTGDNRVCALRLIAGSAPSCTRLTDDPDAPTPRSEEPVVTVPFVLSDVNGQGIDIVIMGDKAGRIWAIQNLAQGHEVVRAHFDMGGWILASPVNGPEPLSFVAGSTNGQVALFQVKPSAGPGMPPEITKSGTGWRELSAINDGFAKEGDIFYAADQPGVFHKFTMPGDHRSTEAPSTPMFANASPAYDATHVYFGIRQVGSTDLTKKLPGRLVAVTKATWQVDWQKDVGTASLNTNPLILPGLDAIVVGDTAGNLYAFDTATGDPKQIFADSQGHWQVPLAPTKAEGCRLENYQTTAGVIEPIVASGWFITGTTCERDPSGNNTGSLRIYQTQGALYNLSWQPTEDTVHPMQPATIHATLNLTATPQPEPSFRSWDVGLAAFWVPSPDALAAGAKVRDLPTDKALFTFPGGTSLAVALPFTPQPADGKSGAVKLFANPRQVLRDGGPAGQELRRILALIRGTDAAEVAAHLADIEGALSGNAPAELMETGLADNLFTAPFETVNLAVLSVGVPVAPVSCIEGAYTVTTTIENQSSRPLGAVLKFSITGPDGTKPASAAQRTFAPGTNTVSQEIGIRQCNGSSYTIQVEVNPANPQGNRAVAESTYDDNRLSSGPVIIEAFQGGGEIEAGKRFIEVLPADCIANPPDDPHPCANYPGLNR